jgi:hypothetical protein
MDLDEFSGQLRKNIRFASRPTRFDFDSLAFDIPDITQALAQGIKDRRSGIRKSGMEKSNDRHFTRLCPRHEGPRRRHAAEQGDELAPPHSITSSAIS